MRKWSLLLLFFVFFGSPSAGQCIGPDEGEYHILHTEEATTVGQGNLQTIIQVGVVKQPDASELYTLPRVEATYGISEWADVDFDYEYLAVHDTDFTSYPSGEQITDHDDSGSGDLRVKIKMTPFEFGRHLLGFQGITKLPNADREKGLGTDETDFTWLVLFTSDWGRLVTNLNAGMAILGDPARDCDKNDYFVWGVSGEYELTDSLTLMAEIYGSTGAENGFTQNITEGTEGTARAQAALALTGPIGDWRWGVLASKGLNSHSNDWEVQAGLSKNWGIGEPAQSAPPQEKEQPETYYNPMVTRTAYTIPEWDFQIQEALDYISQPDDSDLWVSPDLCVGWGIATWADVRLQFQYLKVDDTKLFDKQGNVIEDNIDSDGIGDVWVKVKVSPFQTVCGRLAGEVVTKIPSAEDDDALGTGEVDVVVKGILSTDWSDFFPGSALGRLGTHINAGAAIQSDRYQRSSQNDFFIWGILAEYEVSRSVTVWAELNGSNDSEPSRNISEGVYGNKMAEARLGLTGPFPDIAFLRYWKWGVTASAGLTSQARNWTASVGVSRTWGL